jgi:hypothetical protein
MATGFKGRRSDPLALLTVLEYAGSVVRLGKRFLPAKYSPD